jgi:3-oxoacyl-[acyl-carrier-protein] synthase-1
LATNIYIAADNIISPLGFTSDENFEQLKKMETGVQYLEQSVYSHQPIFAGAIHDEKIDNEFGKLNAIVPYAKLEKLAILSITNALANNSSIDIASKKTLIVLSTTKGNIDLLATPEQTIFDKNRLYLWETANVIARYFKNENVPLVVSNACISGVLAIILGQRLLGQNQYDSIIVCGVDVLSHFVVAGFQSFKAISNKIAKPYDAERDGITLGEACGTIILTNNINLINKKNAIVVSGGASSNDANHISGPSRTGDGLLLAINNALAEAKEQANEIDYISGHGTATVFNDEMECLAITDANLQEVPMNSLKSYYGHTLGAAGIIESIIGLQSMRNNILIGTYNFDQLGVSKPINIIKKTTESIVNNCLKTAAGFGGCNAAVYFKKVGVND